jgi:hypothetical protein
MHNWKPRTLYFFHHRCTATCTSPSGAGEDDAIDARLNQFLGDGRRVLLRVRN